MSLKFGANLVIPVISRGFAIEFWFPSPSIMGPSVGDSFTVAVAILSQSQLWLLRVMSFYYNLAQEELKSHDTLFSNLEQALSQLGCFPGVLIHSGIILSKLRLDLKVSF